LSRYSPVFRYHSISAGDIRRKWTRDRPKAERTRCMVQSSRQMPDKTWCHRPLSLRSMVRASARVSGFPRMPFRSTTIVSALRIMPDLCLLATSSAFRRATRMEYLAGVSRGLRAGSGIPLGSTQNRIPNRSRISLRRGEAEAKIHFGLRLSRIDLWPSVLYFKIDIAMTPGVSARGPASM